MKKNISINLQGMIFHIEEDGYEVLSQYLNSIKAYFSNYAGHEEIIADIESRMAELFFATLTPTKQVITLEDVQALIQKMGSVNDFAQAEAEEETTGAYSQNSYTHTNTGSETGPKRLFRDTNRKVIAGVAAGMAHYFGTDPMWIRLLIIFLIIIAPITAGLSVGFVVITYILCWIALPVDNTVEPEFTKTTGRKLFRNPDDKKLGGVASGLALYFGMDSAIVRLIFLVLFFLGGGGLLLYLLLWLIVPEAKTLTDKVQMQGKPVTLSGIEHSLKSNLQPGGEQPENALTKLILFPVRLVSQILVVLSRVLGPFLNWLMAVVRIFAGILLLMMALAGIIALVTLLGVSLGFIQEGNMVNLNDMPAYYFFGDYPMLGKIAAFLTGFIPCVFFIILALGLLMKRSFLRATVGWSMFAIWLLSGFIFLFMTISYSRNLEERGEFVTEKIFQTSQLQTVSLDANKIKDQFDNDFSLEVESYAGHDVTLVQEFSAEGRSETDAVKNAQMINYRAVQKDSTIVLDDNFTLKPNAVIRWHTLNVKLRLPENKKYRISRDLAEILPASAFDQNYSNEQIARNSWQIKNSLFSCLTCTAADSLELRERNKSYGDDDYDESGSADFLKPDNEFGSNSKKLNADNFRKISAVGPYYIRVRPGKSYAVTARGDSDEMEKMRYEVEDGELKLYFEKSGLNFNSRKDDILITIEMPALTEVILVGASTADIKGFDPGVFKLNLTGATQCFLHTNSNRLEVALTGASEAVLEGNTKFLEANVVGGCELNARNLVSEIAEVEVVGGSDATVQVTRKLTGDVTGGSDLTYYGDPEHINVDESGGSDVTRGEN